MRPVNTELRQAKLQVALAQLNTIKTRLAENQAKVEALTKQVEQKEKQCVELSRESDGITQAS